MESQTVRRYTGHCCPCDNKACVEILLTYLQVYTELQEAITLTKEALNDFQNAAALQPTQQSTAELATCAITAPDNLTPARMQPVRIHLLPVEVPICVVLRHNHPSGSQDDQTHTRKPGQKRQSAAHPPSHSNKHRKHEDDSKGNIIGPQLPQHLASDAQQHPHSSSSSIRPAVHPRNRYADQQPDFQALGQSFPELRQHIQTRQGKGSIDFRKPAACKALTKALLKHDFGITWDIPDGQLVPPLTNRANYVHWLEDLLQLSPPQNTDHITGLDIGCGANCIYPLLGAALNGWRFVGTDVTDIAVQWANRNVSLNPHLANLIEVRRTGQSNSPLDVANADEVGNAKLLRLMLRQSVTTFWMAYSFVCVCDSSLAS